MLWYKRIGLVGAGIFVLFSCSSSPATKVDEAKSLPDSMIVYAPQDREVYSSLMESFGQKSPERKDDNEMVISVAKQFLGIPYVGHTLEAPGIERLQVNLRQFDCTTFTENVITLARLIERRDTAFASFIRELEQLRYRDGKLGSYPSRLHYLSDWIYDNQRKGLVKDVTRELGGIPMEKRVDFMSTHWEKYPALADSTYRKEIGRIEDRINQRKHYYIPKEQVKEMEDGIQNGDIIAITTTIKGLDLIHVGLAIWVDNHVHLMHASSDKKQVVISEKPLHDYLAGNRIQSGIMVVRLQLRPKDRK